MLFGYSELREKCYVVISSCHGPCDCRARSMIVTNAHGLATCELVHFLMLEDGSVFLKTGFMLPCITRTGVDGEQSVHCSHLYHARASQITCHRCVTKSICLAP